LIWLARLAGEIDVGELDIDWKFSIDPVALDIPAFHLPFGIKANEKSLDLKKVDDVLTLEAVAADLEITIGDAVIPLPDSRVEILVEKVGGKLRYKILLQLYKLTLIDSIPLFPFVISLETDEPVTLHIGYIPTPDKKDFGCLAIAMNFDKPRIVSGVADNKRLFEAESARIEVRDGIVVIGTEESDRFEGGNY